MSDIIDINVGEIIEEVTINVVDNVIQVNINKVTGGGSNQNLQEVTDNGNVTTNDIQVENANYFSIIQPSDVGTENKTTGAYAYIGADGVLGLNNGNIESTLKNTNVDNAVSLEFPNKPTGTYTIATTEDTSTQVNSDWNATSGVEEILNKPTIPTNTSDLTNDSNFVSDTDYTHTDNNFTDTLKTKLDGIADGAEVNVNADWNATSGDAQILNKPGLATVATSGSYTDLTNKPTIPAAQIQSDWTQANTSALDYIKNKPTIPSAITQTSQLTNNGSDGVNPFITALDIPSAGSASTLIREVKNMTGATLTKGTVVYISGANGNKALVSKAIATTDATSARTFGLLQSDILNNGLGNCVIIGDLSGLNTSSFAEGAQLYLSGVTAGVYTDTKVLAPTHLVYIGKVTRSHPTQGQIEVQIQNGYELDELHNVQAQSPSNNDTLYFDNSVNQWKTASISTILGYTPENVANKQTDLTASATKYPTVNAVNTALGLKENSANKSTSTSDSASTTKFPVWSAIVSYFSASQIKTLLGQASTSVDGWLSSTDWNIFNNKLTGYLYKLAVSPAAVTGTLSETQVLQLTIPANTFSSNDILTFTSIFQKTGIIGGYSVRVKISTSATMPSGATSQIAVVTIGSTSLFANFNRQAMILNGGNISTLTNTTSLISDTGTSTNTLTTQTFDTTVTNYLYVSITNASTADSVVLKSFKLSNI